MRRPLFPAKITVFYCFGRAVRPRSHKTTVRFCLLFPLHLQILVTYREYAPSFAASANPFCCFSPAGEPPVLRDFRSRYLFVRL